MTLKKLLKIDFIRFGSFLKIPNKFWELQCTNEFTKETIFSFHLSLTQKCDHAGFDFCLEILSFYFCFKIYDCRHWDYDNKCWESYDKENND